MSQSTARVTQVSNHGFGLLLDSELLLVLFEDFAWFRRATIDQISDVQWPSDDHLCWPQLDVDLSVASIRTPDAFPLIATSAQ